MGVSAAFKTLWGKAYVVGLICPPLIGIGLTYSVKLTSGPVRLHVFMAPLAEYLIVIIFMIPNCSDYNFDFIRPPWNFNRVLHNPHTQGNKMVASHQFAVIKRTRLSNLFICITFITKYWIGIQGKLKIRSQNLIFMFHVLIDSNFGLALLLQ